MKQNLLKTWLMLLCLFIGIGGAWAETRTITVRVSSFTNLPASASYGTYSWSEGGVSGKATIYANTSSTYLQFNGSNRLFYSTTAIPGNIVSVKLKKNSGSDRAFCVYGRTSAYDGTSSDYGTQIGSPTAVTTSGTTFNVTSGEYNYFVVRNNTSSAAYLDYVEVTYEVAGGPTLSSIAVKTAPTKTTYTEGETFNPAGLVITKTMSDANTEDVAYSGNESSFTFSPSLSKELSDETSVSITYSGKTTTQAITVNPFVATAGTYEIALNNVFFNCNAFTSKPSGFTSATGTAKGVTITYNAASSAYINDSQCRIYKGTKLDFEAPEGFELTSIVLGTTTESPSISASAGSFSGKTWTGKATAVSLTGTQSSGNYQVTSVTVTYAVASTPDPEKELIGISVSGTPAEFWKGDAFNYNGITVTATWDDETETDVTSSCSFTGYDMSAAGQQTVTVTYEGETTTYNINVQTIANTQATAYTVAQAKDLIDAGKDLATQVYVAGTISEIVTAWNAEYSNITYNISEDGSTTSQQFQLFRCATNGGEVGDIVVAYGTLTKYSDTYEFSAGNTIVDIQKPAAKTITALVVSGTPNKTTYNVGDAFETAGLVVTATYSDESTAEITTGFEWEIDYGTGNEALVAGATSVDVMAYIDEVMSEVYTVEGLTVNVPVTLTSIAVSGTPTKTEYYAGDAFETAGLVVTGHYSNGTEAPITESIEWTIDPETLAEGTTSVDVIAGVGSIVSEIYTVNGLTVTENPYKTATISSFSGTSGDISTGISYEAFQGKASTAPAVYDNNLRLYQNGGYVTVTAVTGLKIASVKITTSGSYASTTVGYCVDNENAPTTGETVVKNSDYTINGLNNKSVSIYCLGDDKNTRLEIAAMEVTYSGTPVVELSTIALSGTYPTEFTKGDEFSHEGMTVTANYTDDSDKEVTSEATFSGYDMNTIGDQTVTVSYTEDEITKTAQYTINVKKAPFVPTPAAEGYEAVDFTTIYSAADANVEDYEGTSFAMAFAKPQGSSTPTKYYVKGNAVRAYVGNTITITGAEAITGVHMGWAEDYVDDEVSITGLGTTTAVVTFSKTCRFTDIAVCYNTLTLNEGSTTVASIVDVPYGEVTVNRTLKAGVWNTFCVPFDMSRAEIETNFGTNASVKALKRDYLSVSGLNFSINFIDADNIEAGVPYMVMIDGEEKASFTVNGAKVNTTALNDVTVTNGGNSLTFQGNYTKMTAPDASFIISSNKFYYVDSTVEVKGFRGYITTESAQGSPVRALSFGFGEGITTGISTNLSAEQQNARIYNLQGMQQSKLSKGVNIVNGKKVIR